MNEHYEALYRFALSLTRAEAEARDLTQHTFYVWATRGHQLRDLTKVKTWLYTTLHRALLQGRRRQSRFPQQPLEASVEQSPAVAPNLTGQTEALQVLPALAQLNEKYQAAVALFYLEDHAYNEIAVILGVPVGTVKSRIARGVAQLRAILLSGDSPVSFREGDRTAAVAGVHELAARKETTAPASRHRLQLPTGVFERASAEWDFSSGPPRELSTLV